MINLTFGNECKDNQKDYFNAKYELSYDQTRQQYEIKLIYDTWKYCTIKLDKNDYDKLVSDLIRL